MEIYYCLIPAAISIFHLMSALFYRRLLIPTFYLTRFIGNIFGEIIIYIILFIIYYVLFTPISIILRLSGKDQIAKKSVSPNWEDVPEKENDPQRIIKQY